MTKLSYVDASALVKLVVEEPGSAIAVIECDALIADRASGISPAAVRTLDAIHVATALALGRTLDAFVTYDERLAEAAREAGLPVVMPAA
jgi:predicted nucleic acid-binding protein